MKAEGRRMGVFSEHIPLPLDNNLQSRSLGQLDYVVDSTTNLLLSEGDDDSQCSRHEKKLSPLVIEGIL